MQNLKYVNYMLRDLDNVTLSLYSCNIFKGQLTPVNNMTSVTGREEINDTKKPPKNIATLRKCYFSAVLPDVMLFQNI